MKISPSTVILFSATSNTLLVNAWDAQGSSDGGCCDLRSAADGGTATRWNSQLADTLNGFLWSENRSNGLLFRISDFFTGTGTTWAPGTHINVAMRPPNPGYKTTLASGGNPMCPSDKNRMCPSGGTSLYDAEDCSSSPDKLWEYANVGFVYGTKYMMNNGMDKHVNNDVIISGCYPTDSNSIDKRNPQGGLGCHPGQYYGCTEDGKCLTLSENNCKCDYDTVPGAQFGDQLANSFAEAAAGKAGAQFWEAGFDSTCIDLGDATQPTYGRDFASCYYTPDNTNDSVLPNGGSFRHLVEAQNTMYQKRDEILNWLSPISMDNDITYWGWNECPAVYTPNGGAGEFLDDNVLDAADGILVVLPPMSNPGDDYQISLCDLSWEALEVLKKDLKTIWTHGNSMPVVLMEQTKGMPDDDCAKYWDNTLSTCDDGFRKGIFTQNYFWDDKVCLLVADDGEVYFYDGDDNAQAAQVCSDALSKIDFSNRGDCSQPSA